MKKLLIPITLLLTACGGGVPNTDQTTRNTMAAFQDAQLIALCSGPANSVITVFERDGEYAVSIGKSTVFRGDATWARPVSTKEFALNFCKGN